MRAAPTLVVGGGADRFYSTDLFRRTAAGVRDGRAVVFRNGGHTYAATSRTACNIILGFQLAGFASGSHEPTGGADAVLWRKVCLSTRPIVQQPPRIAPRGLSSYLGRSHPMGGGVSGSTSGFGPLSPGSSPGPPAKSSMLRSPKPGAVIPP